MIQISDWKETTDIGWYVSLVSKQLIVIDLIIILHNNTLDFAAVHPRDVIFECSGHKKSGVGDHMRSNTDMALLNQGCCFLQSLRHFQANHDNR